MGKLFIYFFSKDHYFPFSFMCKLGKIFGTICSWTVLLFVLSVIDLIFSVLA